MARYASTAGAQPRLDQGAARRRSGVLRGARPERRSRLSLLAQLPLRQHDAGVPAGGAPASREVNRVDVEVAARDQPRDERVRIPHLPGPQFVAAPDRRRHFRHQFEQPSRLFSPLAQALRALDRLGKVGDDAVAPATDLVAEEPEAAGCADADRAFGDDPALRLCPMPAPARSRTGPRAPVLRVPSGRDRRGPDAAGAPQALRTRARSGALSAHRRRAAANRGQRPTSPTSRTRERSEPRPASVERQEKALFERLVEHG